MFGFGKKAKKREPLEIKVETVTNQLKQLQKRYSLSVLSAETESWLIEINSNPDRMSEMNFSETVLEVGKIYTFNYKGTLPIMLCVGHTKTLSGKVNPICINMLLIPRSIRKQILDKIISVYKSQMDENNKNIMWVKKPKTIPITYQALKMILSNSGFEWAMKPINMGSIRTVPKIVTYMEWWRVAIVKGGWQYLPSSKTKEKVVSPAMAQALYMMNATKKVIEETSQKVSNFL